ncbi:MAG: hypothetical protein HYZ53_27975 [Planctomycetes bacterium]|nr:hypothetical protein [Planctomycetota bacterium]
MKRALVVCISLWLLVAFACGLAAADTGQPCAACGLSAPESWWQFCPRCGTKLAPPALACYPERPAMVGDTFVHRSHRYRIDRPGPRWDAHLGDKARELHAAADVVFANETGEVFVVVISEQLPKMNRRAYWEAVKGSISLERFRELAARTEPFAGTEALVVQASASFRSVQLSLAYRILNFRGRLYNLYVYAVASALPPAQAEVEGALASFRLLEEPDAGTGAVAATGAATGAVVAESGESLEGTARLAPAPPRKVDGGADAKPSPKSESAGAYSPAEQALASALAVTQRGGRVLAALSLDGGQRGRLAALLATDPDRTRLVEGWLELLQPGQKDLLVGCDLLRDPAAGCTSKTCPLHRE